MGSKVPNFDRSINDQNDAATIVLTTPKNCKKWKSDTSLHNLPSCGLI